MKRPLLENNSLAMASAPAEPIEFSEKNNEDVDKKLDTTLKQF